MDNVSMLEASISSGATASGKRWGRRTGRVLLLVALAIWMGTAYWHTHKPLPEGVRLETQWQTLAQSDSRFIADITTADAYGRPILSHAIFDEVLQLVRSAREFLVLDYFLFNPHQGALEDQQVPMRALSAELRDALIARKQAEPRLRVLFITDPINDVYGGAPSRDLEMLREAGIDVAVTNLDRLRDSNYLYSSLWRLTVKWWSGSGAGDGWLPNPFDEGPTKVTARSWARLANFKANHRKVIIGDNGQGGLIGIVASANPHDASSAHSNVAMKLTGPVLRPLLASEMAIARFSGWTGVLGAPTLPTNTNGAPSGANSTVEFEANPARNIRARVLTEGAIRDAVLDRIRAATPEEAIDIAMFYLSDRGVIEALLAASRRGVAVRLILDPNKDAFGHQKSGVPNRPVASELVAASDGAIRVRWYRTHGEQFHTKLVMIYGADRVWMTLGSANLTRRNIGDLNLEANVVVEVGRGSNMAAQVLQYFDTLWSNRAPLGIEYTADFEVYADPSQVRYWQYRIMEVTGLSTF
jgi:phosphatidylserine/phosphatidylglycerophosphate/cardiolipin synthase-like enzyme